MDINIMETPGCATCMVKKAIILHLTVDVYLSTNKINSRDSSAPLRTPHFPPKITKIII